MPEFNFEDVIPEGYECTTTYYDGAIVHTYRSKRRDPEKQQKAVNEIAAILFKGYVRSLRRKQAEGEPLTDNEKLILQVQG